VVVCVGLPDVPVMVMVAPSDGAVAFAVKVNTLLVEVEVGLKLAVTPVGNPDAFRLTLPLKPSTGFTVIVLVTLAPRSTLTVLGAADNVKPGVLENSAVTDSAASIVTKHVSAVPEQSPPQPAKVEPVVGVAVSVTAWLFGKSCEQVEVQLLMPFGLLLTLPLPVP
jgi:hypothetical protein